MDIDAVVRWGIVRDCPGESLRGTAFHSIATDDLLRRRIRAQTGRVNSLDDTRVSFTPIEVDISQPTRLNNIGC
jgi:hypothetical protein